MAQLELDLDVLRVPKADVFPEFIDLTRVDVLVAGAQDLQNPTLHKLIQLQNPRILQLVVGGAYSTAPADLASIHNELGIFATLPEDRAEENQDLILAALSSARSLRQNQEYQKMIIQQESHLRSKTAELEESLERRQKSLIETRRKTLISKYRWEILRRALEAIHAASSIGSIEMNLQAVLAEGLNLSSVRISFFADQNDSRKLDDKGLAIHRVTLFRSHDHSIGRIAFYREAGLSFLKEEKEFLNKIAEAVSLAIDRVHQLELAESFREQWQATFNAVSDPVALIDSEYTLVQANSEFLKAQPDTNSQKCYEKLFQRDSPCVGCRLGKNFRLTDDERHFQVYSQAALTEPLMGTIYVNHYQNITEQVRIEHRLAESAKLAELGTIGSSIAHELNNPLGGIISYLQLIKMDLPMESPYRDDILEMEKGALRCKEIIQNLLGFSRTSTIEGAQILDLRRVISKTVNILSLQFKSRGTQIEFKEPADPVLVEGQHNLLAQAFLSLIQGVFLRGQSGLPSLQIQIKIGELAEVFILDAGPGTAEGADFQPTNLSVSQQIFKDHKAVLNLDRSNQASPSIKVSFPMKAEKA